MEIKKVGFASFKLAFNDLSIISDPILSEKSAGKFSAQEGDLVLFTEKEMLGKHNILSDLKFDKITPVKKSEPVEISGPGDYEMGGVIIRRKLGTDFYILDEGEVRIVYFGSVTGPVNQDKLKDLGDVDVLIMPIPGIDPFPTYEQTVKIISIIDPTKFIPSFYNDGYKLGGEYSEAKSVQDFIKNAGYTHVVEEKKLKVVKGSEEDTKVMEVVILS